jgi:hypothetical protein
MICDNQIVLASGAIIHANETSHPTLFKSLKGGSGNFGIVTRFDIETFPSTDLWGGIVVYEHASTVDSQVDALVQFTANVHRDPNASLIPLYTYKSEVGVPLIVNSFVYAKPVAYPDAFGAFYALPNVSDSMRFTGLEGLVGELEPEAGLQYVSCLNHPPYILFKNGFEGTLDEYTNCSTVTTSSPSPSPTTRQSSRKQSQSTTA